MLLMPIRFVSSSANRMGEAMAKFSTISQLLVSMHHGCCMFDEHRDDHPCSMFVSLEPAHVGQAIGNGI